MIRAGKLCKHCKPGRCEDDCPSPESPAEVECPSCGGQGCDGCDDGHFEIRGCPQEMFDSKLIEFTRLANAYEKGLPPVSGGSLDQAAWFVAACDFWWGENERLMPD